MLRLFEERDWAVVWSILQPVFAAGETYAFPRNIEESQAYHEWIKKPWETWVAEVDNRILATYYIKPNQPGQGAHVCNCGYVVNEAARGQGLASSMCEHSQIRARLLSFRAMQYSLVVAANAGAVALWERPRFPHRGAPTGGL